ncbi:MAG: hypothetical protein QF619_05050 [Candidatus Binatia bacterium]|jgi:4,5-dihydroxyphthalate decarboxylase|nr:hypothetical protein [Candidatus Binatia bacterium]
MTGQEMDFALLSRPRSQAILDGRIKPEGLPIRWSPTPNPLGWALPAVEKERCLRAGRFVGGEMSISSFIQAKSRGAPLLALPVFLKRGLVQRSLFCSVDSLLNSPDQLTGKRVGLVGYTSSMAAWMRGVLEEEYHLSPSSLQWFTFSPPSKRIQIETKLLEIPKGFSGEGIEAWEELDGYSHSMERREVFLVSLLEKGELDAVVSFQTRVASNRIRPLLPNEDALWSHYRNKRVYPINHIFALHEELFSRYPGIDDLLLSILKEARKLWVDYLPKEKRGVMEKEMELLDWDPFAYRLGEVEIRTLESFIGYLLKEKLISHRIPLQKLFHNVEIN